MLDNNNIKQQILSKATKYNKDPLFRKFVEFFYAYIPAYGKQDYDIDDFFNIALVTYNEFLVRDVKSHKITIHTPASETDAFFISIINDDMPFLVDSITELLNEKQYKISQMVNALLCTVRNKRGEVVDIKSPDCVPNESVIYIKLSAPIDREDSRILSADLSKMLSRVALAVHDWSPMIKKLNESIQWLTKEDDTENRLFLHWLADGNFTFIGYREYQVHSHGHIKPSSDILGVNSFEDESFNSSIVEDIFQSSRFNTTSVIIGKLREISKIHRYANLDYVCVVSAADPTKARVFLGLFVTRLDYQSVTTIPIIRSKAEAVIARSGFSHKSFNGKELFSIIETLPRDELFQLTEDELFTISMMTLSTLNSPKVLFFIRVDRCPLYLSSLLFLPRSRITHDVVFKAQMTMQKHIKGKVIHSVLRLSSTGLAYIHILMQVKDNRGLNVDILHLEHELDIATRLWDEERQHILESKFGAEYAAKLLANYSSVLPDADYKTQYALDGIAEDFIWMERLSDEHKVLFSLYQEEKAQPNHFKLKVYSLEDKIQLQEIVSLLVNMDLHPIDENVFKVESKKLNKPIWIQEFSIYLEDKGVHNLEDIKTRVQDAMLAVFLGKVKNHPINKLLLKADITWREIVMLHAYCKYLLQINFEYSQILITSTLVNNGPLTKLLVDLFYSIFNPKADKKVQDSSAIQTKINSHLKRILDGAEDKIIRKIIELISNTLRTNYFQSKDYLSFKINSAKMTDMPLPRPHVEVFVYSTRTEGIHLRAGQIARGGIRWSDRVEDYRTEVLALMKAQVTKNAIIVPTGAKGGFLVKDAERFKSREELFAAGVECYKTLLRGILDITDNIIKDKVVKPENVVCLDSDDPYLVVAADKGTATFSDTANKLAVEEYNFWLGDAFASGGSSGYDHKKIAITSRGSWISVVEHFKTLGIDPSKDEFTATGIGDMSGDVFGNGMLRSNKMKLIAAFNNLYIFLDPQPDLEVSFKERQRLFETPRSNWNDYNAKLISSGGGVFERSAKSIKLSKEAKAALNIDQDEVSPDNLIRSILMAPVDLLWNGGIGTYVKAKAELNEHVGDKGNNSLRVNGSDLKCKIVAEGGNLGFTQLGRIEYAFSGGLINTDFIDNSGGVDCSDHEVNIKIALAPAIANKTLSLLSRNKLLAEMQDEVAGLVLKDNQVQNQELSISSAYNVSTFESYTKLMQVLTSKAGLLDPTVEYLPNEVEISRRCKEKIGFSRPELAVLMAYSKLAAYQGLVASKVTNDPYFEKFLINYFPKKMQSKFKNEILTHKLRKEIIATTLASSIIDHTGSYFYHIAQDSTGVNGCDVARAYCAAWEIFDFEKLEAEISKNTGKVRIEMFHEMRAFLREAIYWFLRNGPVQMLNVTTLIKDFKPAITELAPQIDKLIHGSVKTYYKDKINYLLQTGIDRSLATRIASFKGLWSCMDIIHVANKAKISVTEVAKMYFVLGEQLSYNWMREKISELTVHDYWEKMLVKSLMDDVYNQQRKLVLKIASMPGKDMNHKIDAWMQKHTKPLRIFNAFMASIKALEILDATKLVLATKQLRALIR